MDYRDRAIELARNNFDDSIRIIKHLRDDNYELITMATDELEAKGDGLSYPVYCVNKNNNYEKFSIGILGLFDDYNFDNLVPNNMIEV